MRKSLTLQLIVYVGLILLGCISAWAYTSIRNLEGTGMGHMAIELDRLGNTITLGAHYAMALHSREVLHHIIRNIGRKSEIRSIRIFNRQGQIKFSNLTHEVGRRMDMKDHACRGCHKVGPACETVPLPDRTRVFHSTSGERRLGVVSPITNEPGCSQASCHVHPSDKKVLGVLDVVVSLSAMDEALLDQKRGILAVAIIAFISIASMMGVFFFSFVNRPIQELIAAARLMDRHEGGQQVDATRQDEIGQLVRTINQMGSEIAEKQEELNRQRDRYQSLFEQVPCYITVQDRDLRILTCNQETKRQFNPRLGDYCYRAYKGRDEKCDLCPVEQTLEDGASHTSEQIVINRDGIKAHWFVKTTPIKQSVDNITSVMEISLDITQSKRLEMEILKSEEKYQKIFNNIPNSVFVLERDTLEILDCNETALSMYGVSRDGIIGCSFMTQFFEEDRNFYSKELSSANVLGQVRQVTKSGDTLFVNIHISPSVYGNRDALLVVASDITQRLMTEQQLIQTAKMATLGEMSAGVAHELNQPLAVMKTASSFLMKKVRKAETIQEDILYTMAHEISNHVDRASRIINHLREFGRKAGVTREPVDVNQALNRAHEMFVQQFKLKEILVVKELEEGLPVILADANRMEQVFINLLINARDAIMEKCQRCAEKGALKEIRLKTVSGDDRVTVEISDSGNGIPEPVRDKIFEPFFTTKKVGQGTGLGLSISYDIIKDLDGAIRVESREGEGATFIIVLPAAETRQPARGLDRKEEAAPRRSAS